MKKHAERRDTRGRLRKRWCRSGARFGKYFHVTPGRSRRAVVARVSRSDGGEFFKTPRVLSSQAQEVLKAIRVLARLKNALSRGTSPCHTRLHEAEEKSRGKLGTRCYNGDEGRWKTVRAERILLHFTPFPRACPSACPIQSPRAHGYSVTTLWV